MSQARSKKRWLHTGSKAWRDIRKRHLAKEPLCRVCKRPGVDVDHKDGRSEKPSDYRDENLQTLCRSCHAKKTRIEMGFGVAKKVMIRGCDVDGRPLDPEHPFNRRD